jgi:hypothetical protein
MRSNWIEELVSHLYRTKGYVVISNEDLPMPLTAYRRVRGHSDIDVIAIKDNELLHVECQSSWCPEKKDENKQLRRLKDRFEHASHSVFKNYSFLDQSKLSIKNIFVTGGKPSKSRGNGPWDRLQGFCNKNNIELVETNSIITELIAELRKKYPKPERVGREEGITRFLIHLIHNYFLRADEATSHNSG